MDEEGAGLVETAFSCLSAAVAMVQPGAMYRDLGSSIGKIARDRGESRVKEKGGGGGTQFVHGRYRMTIDPRIPSMPGRSTSGFGGGGTAELTMWPLGSGSLIVVFTPSRWPRPMRWSADGNFYHILSGAAVSLARFGWGLGSGLGLGL